MRRRSAAWPESSRPCPTPSASSSSPACSSGSPNLQIPLIETGVGWIPHLLEQMDDRYWRNRSWGNIPITQPPSYYWYRNLSATYITDRNGIANRHAVGVDNMMWSTDYPHHGNDWPYSRKSINDSMADVPADERYKIVAGNAVRIFGLDG